MSDIKLFRLGEAGVLELAGEAVQVEKSLQKLFEANLETLLGVRFLASEFSTGPVHGGRIDTLGLDEDGTPVIIEYKRAVNENVISQGLFYLDWLLDHRKDFQWLVLEKLGGDAAKNVDWSAPRLLCIAGDFTRYDQHAVKQMRHNVELLRYRRFAGDLLMLELVHAPKPGAASPNSGQNVETQPPTKLPAGAGSDGQDPYLTYRFGYRLSQSDQPLRDLYEAVHAYLVGLGDDVQVKELQLYVAFKRIKNFACVEVYPQTRTVLCHLKIDPKTVTMESGFTRDMTGIGHYGTGDLQVILRSMDDLAKAQPLFQRAYDGS